MIGDIETTFEFMKSLLINADIDTLIPIIQDLVIEKTTADRCKIVLFDEQGIAIIDRSRKRKGQNQLNIPTKISKKIVSTVMESKKVVVSPNAMEDTRFSEQRSHSIEDSIMEQSILSVASAPLWYRDNIFGVIYIDNHKKEALFTEKTGQLLKGLAELMSEALFESLNHTIEQQNKRDILQKQLEKLRDEIDHLKGYGEIVGNSPAMKKIFELIEKVKDININVLITGESGTGKELVARALHRKSNRKNLPFIKIDCSVFSETTLESALFGHEKGAFTGADRINSGFIEEAKGGTIFFDEIGNISLNVQRKLLQFLDNKVYYRMGSTQVRTSEARFIFATNKNIQDLISSGNFMEDLYYRISEGIEFRLPPLRERDSDIILIAQNLLKTVSSDMDKTVKDFNEDAKQILLHYTYPGNVRELHKIVLGSVLNTESEIISAENLPKNLFENGSLSVSDFELENGEHILSKEKDEKTYLKYLTKEYHGKTFIWGFSDDEKAVSDHLNEQSILHNYIIINVKNAFNIPLKEAVKAVGLSFERNYIIDKLISTNGKIAEAHTLSQVDKKTFIDKIKKVHSLKREWYVK